MSVSATEVRQRIEDCQGLVRSLALSIHRKMPPSVDLDDLIAYGQVGLSEAARDFDATRGSRFSTYAYYRIRGAIYDGLSKMSWFGRAQYSQDRCPRVHDDLPRSEDTKEPLPTDEDAVADASGLRQLRRAMAVISLAANGSGKGAEDDNRLEATLVDATMPSASTDAICREDNHQLHRLIEALPVVAAVLIRATYFEGFTLQEAGQRLGMSKSWASRVHARALEQLARGLRQDEVTM